MKKLDVKIQSSQSSKDAVQEIIEPLRARFPGTIVRVEFDPDLRAPLVVHAYGFHESENASQEAVEAACQLVRETLGAVTDGLTEPSIDSQEAT